MRAVLSRDGGPFSSSSSHGRIDLPESCISWLLSKRRSIVDGWRAFFSNDLPQSISSLVEAYSQQLQKAGVADLQREQASERLKVSLLELKSQRQRDIEGRLVDAFRPTFALAARAAVDDGTGRPDKGPSVVERVRARFLHYIEHHIKAMATAAVQLLRDLLHQDLELLHNECTRHIHGVMATMTDQDRRSSAARGSDLLDAFRNVARIGRITASPTNSANQPRHEDNGVECQVNFDGPVTGRVEGCTCTPPKVCFRCFLRIINNSRDRQCCPYCRGVYNLATGFREGDVTLHCLLPDVTFQP